MDFTKGMVLDFEKPRVIEDKESIGCRLEEEKCRRINRTIKAVSYTHLDVYKRQQLECEQQLFQAEWEKQSCEAEFKRIEKAYMEELKADSVRCV